jgi:hypothetical protein
MNDPFREERLELDRREWELATADNEYETDDASDHD